MQCCHIYKTFSSGAVNIFAYRYVFFSMREIYLKYNAEKVFLKFCIKSL